MFFFRLFYVCFFFFVAVVFFSYYRCYLSFVSQVGVCCVAIVFIADNLEAVIEYYAQIELDIQVCNLRQ